MRISILAIVLVCLAAPSKKVWAEPSSEVKAMASEVLSVGAWRAESRSCPSGFVQSREVKDHLDKNECRAGQLSSCLRKCKAGKPSACYWLGHAVSGTSETQEAAEVLYQRSCKLGVMSGCTNRAAGMLSEDRESASAQACAAETFAKTCGFDDPWACTMYAFHLGRGIGVQRDVGLALKVLGKSCRYGAEDETCLYGMRLRKELLQDEASRRVTPR